MVGSISYYFTLFKKFQALGHVPEQQGHGDPNAPLGGFNLNDPSSVFGHSAQLNPLLGSAPGNSPLWQLLNAAATNVPSVQFSGIPPIPSMPFEASTISPPPWVAFQYSSSPPLVTVFGDWITAGKTNDIPKGAVNPNGGAILNVPTTKIAGQLDNGVSLFACSMPNDNGQRPGAVPSNYWTTSLIYLVEPLTGNTATPGTLNDGAEYFLVGVIGNRGTTNAGQYGTSSYVSNPSLGGDSSWLPWSGAQPSVLASNFRRSQTSM